MDERLIQALDSLNSGDAEAAYHYFSEVLDQQKEISACHYGSAVALARLGRTKEARTLLGSIIAAVPEHKKAILLLKELASERQLPHDQAEDNLSSTEFVFDIPPREIPISQDVELVQIGGGRSLDPEKIAEELAPSFEEQNDPGAAPYDPLVPDGEALVDALVDEALSCLGNDKPEQAYEKISAAMELQIPVRDCHYVSAMCTIAMKEEGYLEKAVEALKIELQRFPDNSAAQSLLDDIQREATKRQPS